MGLKSINDRFKKQAETQTQQSYIRQLKLGEGEKAWFRFMSSGEDDDHRLEDFYAHPIKDDNGRYTEAFCMMDQPGGTCQHCLTDKPKMRFGVWVWVNYVLRKRQNPSLEKNPNAKPWKKVKYKDELYYQQLIDDVRLFVRGPGKGRYLWNQLVKHAEDFGTLMDREYLLTRTGDGLDSTYTILPTNETSKLTEKQVEIYRQLPSVTDVMSGGKSWPPRDQKTEIVDESDAEELVAPSVVPSFTSDKIEIVDDLENENGVEELEAVRPSGSSDIDKAIEMAMAKITSDDEDDE